MVVRCVCSALSRRLKLALPRIAGILGRRRSRIDTDLEKAKSLKKEADEVLAAHEKSLAEATEKAQAIHRIMSDELIAERNSKLDEVADNLSCQFQEAEKLIAAEKLGLLRQLAMLQPI